MRDVLRVTLAMSVLIVGPACRSTEPTPDQRWPVSAASAADSLRDKGFRCLEEGRELYPLFYACTLDGNLSAGGIYLYANDRNDVVGIRAFASDASRASDRFFEVALSLSGLQGLPSQPIEFDVEEKTYDFDNNLVIETGSSHDVRYLRITPKNEISTQ